jgi:hypothetical protein
MVPECKAEKQFERGLVYEVVTRVVRAVFALCPKGPASLLSAYADGALQHTWSQNGQLRSGARDVNKEPARPSESARLVYSNRCGRIRLNNVTVRNAGINWENPKNCYWSHKVCS